MYFDELKLSEQDVKALLKLSKDQREAIIHMVKIHAIMTEDTRDKTDNGRQALLRFGHEFQMIAKPISEKTILEKIVSSDILSEYGVKK